MASVSTDDSRKADLAARLAAVRARVAVVCADAGRDPGDVTTIAVTKTYPAIDVVRLAALGLTDIGENRDQEAAGKAAAVAAAGASVTWHFVGRLQRNKCRSVVRYADVVHSLDSVGLVRALATAARRHRESPVDVLVQVSLDGDPSRGGAVVGPGAADDARLERVLETAASEDDVLRLRGLMAVAPLEWDSEAAFERLAEIAVRVRQQYPEAAWLSAGMSADMDAALKHGSTHIRIGSALLGKRPALR